MSFTSSQTQSQNSNKPPPSNANGNPTSNPPMSSTTDKHFTRLSLALETLIKSLATYNPTPALANDLVLADAELNLGLDELHTHQTNYARILTLRAQSALLDTQIKDTLTLLTTTRAEVIATPGTKLPDDGSVHAVSYSDLLSYARRISRTTLPGTYREADPSSQNGPENEGGNQSGGNINANANEVGTGAEAAGTTAVNPNPNPNATTIATIPNGVEKPDPVPAATSEHSTRLPTQFEAATTLPPTVFTPWPHDTLLRRGALATIQNMLENSGGENGESWKGLEDLPVGGEGVNVDEGGNVEGWLDGEGGKDHGMREAARPSHGEGQQNQQQKVVKKKAAFELETFESDDEEE